MRTRLAPTPSGHLHIGNAMSFLLTWLTVRAARGEVFLRIDDLDGPRVSTEFVDGILEDLRWLSLDWDRQWFQNERTAIYTHWLDAWKKAGQLYACRCTRSQMQSNGGVYAGTCRHLGLPLDDSNPWRLRLERGDVIVRRREGMAAYHLASLADDIEEGINYIVRGEDLWESTAIQQAMARSAELAGIPGAAAFASVQFVHHPLIAGPDGGKLSKSRNASPLRELRASGQPPASVYQQFLRWQGMDPTGVNTIDELKARWVSAPRR